MNVWYFAYGSNLLTDQMHARTGWTADADDPPRVVRLLNYRLVFQQCEPGGAAYANIVAVATSETESVDTSSVLGVAYRCTEAELAKLDMFEHGYHRAAVTVVEHDGRPLEAVAYLVGPAEGLALGKPDDVYLRRITTGARQHGLPEAYIAAIIAIAGDAALSRPTTPSSRRA